MSAKAVLRKVARGKIAALSTAERAEKSARICTAITQMAAWEQARVIGVFAAQPTEPDLTALWDSAAGKTICYPRVNGVDLDLISVDDPAALQTSGWQLREPMHDEARIIAPSQIDLLFVPGLAFTREGARLGRGGGFYDRLLARPELRARTVGVCFDTQLFEELPSEPHDRPVDALATESLGPV